MSSCDRLPEYRLRRRLLVGHVAYGCVMAGISIPLFIYLYRRHHDDLCSCMPETLLILAAVIAIFALIAAGLYWSNQMAAQYTKTLNSLRQLSDDIAHDLRTPLTRLSAAAELSVTGGLPAEELAATVGAETQNLLHLINTMLDISRTEQRLERSASTFFDPGTVCRDVIDLYRPMAEGKSQNLKVSLEPVARLRGSEVRFRQLVQNLLDNALKFTPEGGEIVVDLVAQGKDMELAVGDNGPGIPEQDQKRIFDRFYRGDAARTKPGNGLGLALVKAIATSFGGTVSCQNRFYDYGAQFTVTLKGA